MTSGSSMAGENYTLECSASGSNGTFQWLKNGMTLVVGNNSRLEIIPNAASSRLQFRPAAQSDNGSYSCNATVGELSLSSEPVVISVNGIFIPHIHCT